MNNFDLRVILEFFGYFFYFILLKCGHIYPESVDYYTLGEDLLQKLSRGVYLEHIALSYIPKYSQIKTYEAYGMPMKLTSSLLGSKIPRNSSSLSHRVPSFKIFVLLLKKNLKS